MSIDPLNRFSSVPTIAEETQETGLTNGPTQVTLSPVIPCVWGKRIHIMCSSTGDLTDILLQFTGGYNQLSTAVSLATVVTAGADPVIIKYDAGMGQTVQLVGTKAGATTGTALAWIAVLS